MSEETDQDTTIDLELQDALDVEDIESLKLAEKESENSSAKRQSKYAFLKRWYFIVLYCAVAFYLLIGIIILLFQDIGIYPTVIAKLNIEKRGKGPINAKNVKDLIEFKTSDGISLAGIWSYPKDSLLEHSSLQNSAQKRPTLLYCPGNGESFYESQATAEGFARYSKCNVFTFVYRGYPGSEGTPSEAGLKKDVLVTSLFVFYSK